MVTSSACKSSEWRRRKAEIQEDQVQGAKPPQLTKTAEASPSAARDLELDERSGRPKASLVLRLDHFPEPRPGATTLPACYATFASEFALGYVECEGKPETRRPLLAANVEQVCYTDTNRKAFAAREPLSLPGCRRARMMTHRYQPPIILDVELRELN